MLVLRLSRFVMTYQHTIADIERDTGIAKDTLRVWERRYGFPQPERDANGERRYDDVQLQRLRHIKRLMDGGYRPNAVVSLPLEALQALGINPPSVRPARHNQQRQAAHQGHELDPQWLQWVHQHDMAALQSALQQHLQAQGLALTAQELITPLSAAVGEAWLRGDLAVYEEHLYTQAIASVLRAHISHQQAQSLPTSPPRVLLTTVPGEQHGLGLLLAECFFSISGCHVFPLGIHTPLPDIVLAASQLQADIVALSFSAHHAAADVKQALAQLRSQLPPTTELWVGGSAPVLHQRLAPPHCVVLHQASDVPEQVQRWRAALAS